MKGVSSKIRQIVKETIAARHSPTIEKLQKIHDGVYILKIDGTNRARAKAIYRLRQSGFTVNSDPRNRTAVVITKKSIPTKGLEKWTAPGGKTFYFKQKGNIRVMLWKFKDKWYGKPKLPRVI